MRGVIGIGLVLAALAGPALAQSTTPQAGAPQAGLGEADIRELLEAAKDLRQGGARDRRLCPRHPRHPDPDPGQARQDREQARQDRERRQGNRAAPRRTVGGRSREPGTRSLGDAAGPVPRRRLGRSRTDDAERRDIRLYATRLPAGAPAADAIALLSAAERERAGRLVAPVHQGAFIAGRRSCAASSPATRGSPPARSSSRSKPSASRASAPGQASGAIAFSFSRTRGLALVGVTAGAPLGVDVEQIRAFDDFEGVARRFFAPGEHRALGRLPPPARLRGFFECWTRKEAVVKALGVGLSVPLDSFEVAFGPGVAPEIARIDLDAPPPGAWSLVHLEPLEGVIGAVAAPFEVRSVEGVMLS